jgi:hypothetical protein
MKWFLDLLDRLGRKRIVYDRENNEPYLERYYLFLKDRKRFPFNIFLHKFLKGDPDHVHDLIQQVKKLARSVTGVGPDILGYAVLIAIIVLNWSLA